MRTSVSHPLQIATVDSDVSVHGPVAYVFPSKLDRDKSDEVDYNLRLQRLNVGLSRGQEKIVFVDSKPLGHFASKQGVIVDRLVDLHGPVRGRDDRRQQREYRAERRGFLKV